jgi:hypothetical protein
MHRRAPRVYRPQLRCFRASLALTRATAGKQLNSDADESQANASSRQRKKTNRARTHDDGMLAFQSPLDAVTHSSNSDHLSQRIPAIDSRRAESIPRCPAPKHSTKALGAIGSSRPMRAVRNFWAILLPSGSCAHTGAIPAGLLYSAALGRFAMLPCCTKDGPNSRRSGHGAPDRAILETDLPRIRRAISEFPKVDDSGQGRPLADLQPEDVQAALAYAAWRTKEIDLSLT